MNDKYLHFKLDDFVLDNSFVDFVTSDNKEEEALWNDWFAKHPKQESIAKEAAFFIKNINFKEESISKIKEDRIWNTIDLQTNSSASINIRKKKSRGIRNLVVGIAASLLLFVVGTGIWKDKDILVSTSFAEMKTVDLPDLSLVELNVDSKINFSDVTWDRERKVYLSGEAFFEVKKGKSFVVQTEKALVEVLGTSFNVFDREGLLEVKCETGSVQVVDRTRQDTIVLLPGKAARISGNNDIELYNFLVGQKDTWKDGVINFRNKSLALVFASIERHYDVKITASSSILDRSYTGLFVLNNLEQSLHGICWPMHLEYTIEGENISIK